jgi:hypothetical protein
LHAAASLEALLLGDLARGALDDGAGPKALREHVEQQGGAARETHGAPLHRQSVPEHIHDQSREPVTLGVDRTKAGGVCSRHRLCGPSLPCPSDARGKERLVQGLLGIAREEADDNGGLRRVQPATEWLALGVTDDHFIAWLRSTLDLGHRLCKDPRVAGPHGLNVAWL